MKATELITQLQALVAKYGDQSVLIREDGCGGYGMHTAYCSESIGDMPLSQFGEMSEPDEETLKEMFPNVNFEGEDFYDFMEKYEGRDRCVYFTIGCGSLIYST